MSDSEEAGSEAPPIRTKSVEDLVRVVKQCKGEYAFLVGAGTSKPAGIPTSGELIEEWQEEVYEDQNPDADFEEWVESVEDEEMPDGWSEYGFWFEKAYPAKASRREYIRDLVEDETPSFGIIILASMMAEGYVPLALTPNFDDLLYDAFYLFLEDKPMLVDHDAIAPQLKLTDDRPTIVKLHGDYLYDNLKNTADETGELEENMQDAMKQALGEYGLVVVGYAGEDESIMNVLQEEPISDYELFWCGRDDINDVKEAWGKDKEGLSQQAESMLEESENAYYVPIEGAEELFAEFWLGFDAFSPPQPEEIRERADMRAKRLKMAMEERRDEATGDEEELLELWEAIAKAERFREEGELERAKSVLQRFLEQSDPSTEEPRDYASFHNVYGNLLRELNRPREAEEHYKQALEFNSNSITHNNYAYLLFDDLERPNEAEYHLERAIELNPQDALAHNTYGYFLFMIKDQPRQAETHLRRSIELDHEYKYSRKNYGKLLHEEFDRYQEAADYYRQALELDSDFAEAHHLYAKLLQNELDRPEEAEHHFERAVELDPEYAEEDEDEPEDEETDDQEEDEN